MREKLFRKKDIQTILNESATRGNDGLKRNLSAVNLVALCIGVIVGSRNLRYANSCTTLGYMGVIDNMDDYRTDYLFPLRHRHSKVKRGVEVGGYQ